LIISVWMMVTVMAQAEEQSTEAAQLWQVLDYVAVDYAGAVKNGAVVSALEYTEMQDFTANAVVLAQRLPDHPSKQKIVDAILGLREAVLKKAHSDLVAQRAQEANGLIVRAYPIPVAPRTTPDLSLGARLYASHCASCHGAQGAGDGPLAASLDPAPIAFTDAERARSRSIMALYQITSQGVEGTSMASFAELSDDDRWSLAFYV